jgi:hypothetical protein
MPLVPAAQHPDPHRALAALLRGVGEMARAAAAATPVGTVQAARIDNPAPTATSAVPVPVYALTPIGPVDSLVVAVDVGASDATTAGEVVVGYDDVQCDVLDWTGDGGYSELSADVPDDGGLVLTLARTAGTGSVWCRVLACWPVPPPEPVT